MKKIVLIGLLLLSLFVMTPTLKAMSFLNQIGISVTINEWETMEDEEPLDGYFDILIPIVQFNDAIRPSIVTDNFKANFPDYEHYDYLRNETWISYLAYFENANFYETHEPYTFEFYSHLNDLYFATSFKIVKVNSEGDITSESEVIVFPALNRFEKQDIIINYDIENDSFEVVQLVSERVIFFVFMILFGISFTFLHFVIRFLILNGLKVKNHIERKLLFVQLLTTIPATLLMVQLLFNYPIFQDSYSLYGLFFGILLVEIFVLYLTVSDKSFYGEAIKYNMISFLPYSLIILLLVIL